MTEIITEEHHYTGSDGALFIGLPGGDFDGFYSLGSVVECTINIASKKVIHRSSRSRHNEVDQVILGDVVGTLELKGKSFNYENLALILGGSVTETHDVDINEQYEHMVHPGMVYPLNGVIDSDLIIKTTDELITYEEGINYDVVGIGGSFKVHTLDYQIENNAVNVLSSNNIKVLYSMLGTKKLIAKLNPLAKYRLRLENLMLSGGESNNFKILDIPIVAGSILSKFMAIASKTATWETTGIIIPVLNNNELEYFNESIGG